MLSAFQWFTVGLMISLPASSSDIYAVQTLYDGKWRLDKKFAEKTQAQKYAYLLVSDWGKARVRLLAGRYDTQQQRRRYYEVPLLPPPKWHHGVSQHFVRVFSRAGGADSRVKAGPLLGIVFFILALAAVGSMTAFPTNAAGENEGKTTVAQSGLSVLAKADVLFAKAFGKGYAKSRSLEGVPLRLQGDWSRHCASGHQDLQISGQHITEFDGAIAHDIALEAVYQAGQIYGLVREGGTVTIVELVAVDQLKPVGRLMPDGNLTEAAQTVIFKRCL